MAKIKSLIMAALALAFLTAAATGCNTVRGAGQDIESVGETVSGTR